MGSLFFIFLPPSPFPQMSWCAVCADALRNSWEGLYTGESDNYPLVGQHEAWTELDTPRIRPRQESDAIVSSIYHKSGPGVIPSPRLENTKPGSLDAEQLALLTNMANMVHAVDSTYLESVAEDIPDYKIPPAAELRLGNRILVQGNLDLPKIAWTPPLPKILPALSRFRSNRG